LQQKSPGLAAKTYSGASGLFCIITVRSTQGAYACPGACKQATPAKTPELNLYKTTTYTICEICQTGRLYLGMWLAYSLLNLVVKR
jgi:hypothetical protein